VYLALFGRAFCMSLLQSAGVVLLAKHSMWSVVTAFLISYLWISATRLSVDHRERGTRIAYGLGGGMGAAVTLAVAGLLG
jgi:hypothetical protein